MMRHGSNSSATRREKARGLAVNPWALIGERVTGDTLVSLYYRARTHFQKHHYT
jgi:hypothetical protein